MNPFKKVFPYSKQYIDNSDIEYVKRVLKQGFITQGPEIIKTEKKIAKYVGSKYAVLVSSCSAGLHISCKALQINKSSRVITTPITFVSTATSALHCGANVSLSDIDKDSINLSLKDLNTNIKEKNLDLIIPVHFSGFPCEMKKIRKMASKKKINIIEDAAHAFGAKYQDGSRVGNCKYSDLTVFSFHPVKIITGGEGGAVTTNSKKLYNKLLEYRSHGINKDPKEKFIDKIRGYTNKKKNIWYYEMKDLGYHYRQTDIQSALINSQINKLNLFLNFRKKVAEYYDKLFQGLDLIKVYNSRYRKQSSNHLYIIKIEFKKLKISRNDLMIKLRKFGIITQVHYIPLYFHPYFKNKKIFMKKNSNSIKYYQNCLSIPIYYGLKPIEQKYIFSKIKYLVYSNIK